MGLHDAAFRRMMNDGRTRRALLRERLPPTLARALQGEPELVSERFVRGSLRGHTADAVLRARLRDHHRELLVFCVIEHKRTSGPAGLLQLLDYVLAKYRALLRHRPRAKLRLVVGLLLYNGRQPWRGARTMRDLIDLPRGATRLAVQFEPVLVDVRDERLERLGTDPALRRALLMLKAAAVPLGELPRVVQRFLQETRGDEDVREFGLQYFTQAMADGEPRRVLDTAVLEYKHTQEPEMRTAHDYYVEKARRTVEKEARAAVAAATREGRAKGRAKGRAEGHAQGHAQGRAQGRADALRDTLRALLLSRFKKVPAKFSAHLKTDDAAVLEKWFRRALTAESLSAIFNDA